MCPTHRVVYFNNVCPLTRNVAVLLSCMQTALVHLMININKVIINKDSVKKYLVFKNKEIYLRYQNLRVVYCSRFEILCQYMKNNTKYNKKRVFRMWCNMAIQTYFYLWPNVISTFTESAVVVDELGIKNNST